MEIKYSLLLNWIYCQKYDNKEKKKENTYMIFRSNTILENINGKETSRNHQACKVDASSVFTLQYQVLILKNNNV
jgi:hypothetical protein